MIEVELFEDSAGRVIDIVHELRAQGLVQGQDFDFEFRPTAHSPDGWHIIRARSTLFKFHTEVWATWFSLRYL